MARVKEITIGITDSVKIGEYQYVKPSLQFTLELKKGELFDDYLPEAEQRMIDEMEKLKKKIVMESKKKGYR